MSIFKRALFVSVSGAALAVAIEPQVRRWVEERDRRFHAARDGHIVMGGMTR